MAALTLAQLTSLYETGRHSDLTITCQEARFSCHRNILCSASEFFRAACEHEFKEKAEATIDLPEDDQGYIKEMLRFIYLHEFPMHHCETCPDGTLEWGRTLPPSCCLRLYRECLGLYLVADKYGVEPLKNACSNTFCCSFSSITPDHVSDESAAEINDIVEEFLDSSVSSDELRSWIVGFCIQTFNAASWFPGLGAIIQRHEPVAYKTGMEAVQQLRIAKSQHMALGMEADRSHFLLSTLTQTKAILEEDLDLVRQQVGALTAKVTELEMRNFALSTHNNRLMGVANATQATAYGPAVYFGALKPSNISQNDFGYSSHSAS